MSVGEIGRAFGVKCRHPMSLNELAEVIKALPHEPLAFYSLVFLILGFISYRLVEKLPKPTPAEVVAVILAIILLGFSGVALAIIRAGNKVSAQTEEHNKPPNYTAVMKFTGERRILHPTQVAFRNSSGQVNFGCGESKPVSSAWNAPPGAEQINASASWVNTDNVKSQDQHVTIAGNTATATGVISGRDREWTGNCPGGGHGELVVQGSYQLLQPTAAEPFEFVQSGSVSKDKPLVIPLPTEQGLQIQGCETTVIFDGGSPIVLHVALVPASGSSDIQRDQKGAAELAVSGKEAVLSVTDVHLRPASAPGR